MPSPDELREAAARRMPRRRAISTDATATITVSAGAVADGATYSTSNVTRGVALGPTYTQVSVKLPDDPLGDALRSALADGIGDSISDVARQWLAVGADAYLASKAAQAPTEGNPTP